MNFLVFLFLFFFNINLAFSKPVPCPSFSVYPDALTFMCNKKRISISESYSQNTKFYHIKFRGKTHDIPANKCEENAFGHVYLDGDDGWVLMFHLGMISLFGTQTEIFVKNCSALLGTQATTESDGLAGAPLIKRKFEFQDLTSDQKEQIKKTRPIPADFSCPSCGSSETPEIRRVGGELLCNRCGLKRIKEIRKQESVRKKMSISNLLSPNS